MNNNTKHLTKNLFKLALECPTKLFYATNSEYHDQNSENSFLQSLAEGGYQVGALAKVYFPGGHDIKTLNKKAAFQQTNKLLKAKNVTIYEPAFLLDNFFIRVDIIVKNDRQIEIIEVKSKVFDGIDEQFFYSKQNNELSKEWLPYLYDIAFQTHIVASIYKDCQVDAFLMLPDKNSKASIDNLNTKFQIYTHPNGTKTIRTAVGLTKEKTGNEILKKINVTETINKILNDELGYKLGMSFKRYINYLADRVVLNEKIETKPHVGCVDCQFKTDKASELFYKSGFDECWESIYERTGYTKKDDTVLTLWNFRGKQTLMDSNIYFLNDVSLFNIFDSNIQHVNLKNGLERRERQWIQIVKSVNNDKTPYFNRAELKTELDKAEYPLHFIDFETTMAAIPFFKGMHPYEGIAFQFSHHILHKNGKVEHAGQFLSTTPGKFPNFDFIRNLKMQLENDNGTVFCYSQHENTYLNFIFEQIYKQKIEDVPDKQELLTWIKTITHSSKNSSEQWFGKRNMFDMLDLIKKHYYNPYTKGSNSIKYVLPAVLNSSKLLQKKYGKPIYGSTKIKSQNFENQTWIKFDNDEVINPYKLLPELVLDNSSLKKIAEGGSAMSAFGVLQFEKISTEDRTEIEKALLKYCELDTFSMVVIWEYFIELVNQKETSVKQKNIQKSR
jgi:hypothetical protein